MKTKLLLLMLAASLGLGFGSASAQFQVEGVVRDATTSEPLPAVNIVIKGSIEGTTSDINGAYSLTAPSQEDTLIFSFIGFDTQEVGIAGRSVIDVDLIETVYEVGQELVVTGYGSQERRAITGSVSNLGEGDFVSGNVNSVEQMIQGKVAGLQITTRSGDPQRLSRCAATRNFLFWCQPISVDCD